MEISVKNIRFFVLLLVVQVVVGVQDDIESDDELVFAHIVSSIKYLFQLCWIFLHENRLFGI